MVGLRRALIGLLASAMVCSAASARAQETKVADPQAVARTLASLDTWILAQPKVVLPSPGVTFDLAACKGVVAQPDEEAAGALARSAGSKLGLPVLSGPNQGPAITLTLAGEPGKFPRAAKVDAAAFEELGDQGYALAIDSAGVALAARTPAGLRYAVTTLAQIAMDRRMLPGMVIRDWPSLRFRGAQQDISRGQVPTTEALERLADVLAEGKMNVLELYIEHVYKYKALPDISPPEGLSPEDAVKLSSHAAEAGIEVHPLLQALGHSYHILEKPRYRHLRVGPCEKMPWIMTFDIRKPEAVDMIRTMIDELCDSFPGKLFNVDITEIDIDGLQASGLNLDQTTDLVFNYVLQLDAAVRKRGRRLMIAQGPLESRGHLSGMGPKLDLLPKDIIIGSYYCAGGPYQPAWEKDFPRLREKGIDFFAQAWIYSHLWLTPWVKRAAEFSELEVSRGLRHGAAGSITCDWGDAGHFHFVGEEWLPYLYHGACAWTGARMDRDYFRRAFARILYGLTGDAAIRAMETASDVNAMPIRVRDANGKEVEISTTFMWEFVHDPFTHPDITRIVDPAAAGRAVLAAAAPALSALSAERPKARRNQENLNQWLFGVRCYVALGRKLLAAGRAADPAVPRGQAADELEEVAKEFETLQADFRRLWFAEDRDNEGFQELLRRFTYTIAPCREKAKALRAGK